MNALQLQRHPFYYHELKTRGNKKIQRKARPRHSSQFTKKNRLGNALKKYIIDIL